MCLAQTVLRTSDSKRLPSCSLFFEELNDSNPNSFLFKITWILRETSVARPSSLAEIFALIFKDSHRGKASSNKTPALTKSMNMDILGSWYIKPTLHKRFLN